MLNKNLISILEYVFITIVFFSLPPIITWDGGHYLHYIPILNGDIGFENWDIARGISFPMLIYIFHNLIGDSLNSLLVLFFIFYILSYAIVKQLLFTFNISNKISLLLFIVFFVLDTLIFNWYHVLLTEFLTSSIALASVYLAYEYGIIKYEKNKLKFLLISLYFVVMLPITYHIKQPYVLLVLLPLIFSLFTFYVDKAYNDGRTIKLKLLVILISLIGLFSSMVLWKNYLISHNNQMSENRSTAYFLNKQLIHGVRMIGGSNMNFVHTDNYTLQSIKANLILTEDEKNDLINIISNDANNFVSFSYIFYLLKTHPIELIQGYTINYLAISNLYPHEMYENDAIAYRNFNTKLDTTFYMPPYEQYITNYKQYIKEKSLLVKLFEHIKLKSDFLFKFLPIFSIFSMIISLILIKRNRHQEISMKYYFIFMLSSISFLHILAHAILGATIDRYAFPVYPLMILVWILFIEMIISKLKKKGVQN